MILIFDAPNLIHKLYHAQGGTGVLDSAVTRMNAIIDHVRPKHVVACFDSRSFRYDLFPDYKARRKPKEDGLVRELADAPEAFQNVATVCQMDGFEADDLLASFASCGRVCEEKTVLVTGDKDCRQCLVAGEVTILRDVRTERGVVASCDWYTASNLKTDYGLQPGQWTDYQALVGDTGDNIAGCKGWGEKTAVKALAACDGLRQMADCPLAIPVTPRLRDAFMAFWRTDGELTLKLVTLRNDLDVWDWLR